MTRLAAILSLCVLAGCAGPKQVMLPMEQPARVPIPGAIRTLLFEKVTDSPAGVPAGYEAATGNNAEMIKGMMSGEFSASTYAVLNDELMAMVKKHGTVPHYLAGGPTVAADFLKQMVGDPGSIGVVEIEAASGFGEAYRAEQRPITLTTTTYAGGRPNVATRTVNIPVHSIHVYGAVSATIRIRTPYPDGKVVFEKTYTVPPFHYSSVESAPRDLFFFSRNEAARQGAGAPTVTEVKAIQFKKLARMFFEDISPSVKEVAVDLDDRGDPGAYNLLAAGAYGWAEGRLRKIGETGKPQQVAANTYNLGVAWEAQGLPGEASTKYKAALDMEPGNAMFRRAYERTKGK